MMSDNELFPEKSELKPVIYADEQRAKAEWKGPDNPYAALPKMVMLTYKIPESMQAIANQGEFDEFDLNVFFSARGEGEDAKFVYEDYVQKWLNLIRGSHLETAVEELKLRPLNGDYRDIEIARGDDLKIVAEFKTVLRA